MIKFSVAYIAGYKNDSSWPQVILADYYKFEEPWILFKDQHHKTLAAVKSDAVVSIFLV